MWLSGMCPSHSNACVCTQKMQTTKGSIWIFHVKGPSLEVSFHCDSRHFAFQGPWPSDRTSKSHIANENLHQKHWILVSRSHKDFQFQGPCVILYPKVQGIHKAQCRHWKYMRRFAAFRLHSHGHCGIVCIMFRSLVVLGKCRWHHHATRLNRQWLPICDSPCQWIPSHRWHYLGQLSRNDSDR